LEFFLSEGKKKQMMNASVKDRSISFLTLRKVEGVSL